MSGPPFDPAAHLAHMEAVLGLSVDDAWRDGVIAQIAATRRMADLVLAFPLDDRVEPATTFEADR